MMNLMVYYVLLFAVSGGINVNSCSNIHVSQGDLYKNKIDSVLNTKFKYLEKVIEVQGTFELDETVNIDSILIESKREKQIITFFEALTQIEASTIHVYAMDKQVTKKIVRKWKNWCNTHRGLLIWEIEKSRINRKDFNIYSTKN